MDVTSPADRSAFLARTGFDLQLRGGAWLPLQDSLRDLVQARLRKVAWIPTDVIDALMAVPRTQAGSLIIAVPVPYTMRNGTPAPGMPRWLDTADKRIWWDDFAAEIQQAAMAFNDGQIARGRILMNQAAANIALWDRAIAIAKFLGAPVRLLEEGAAQFLSSNVFKVLMVGGIAYGIFHVMSQRSAGRRRISR